MSFFATPLGVRVGAGLAALATAGGFAASWLPNTVYIKEYRDVFQFYRDGLRVKLSEEMEKRTQSVLNDVQIDEKLKKHISFFHVTTQDPFYAGTPESGYGAIVGIPMTFTFKRVEKVPIFELGIVARDVKVAWDSPSGKLLKESLIFPEAAQKFAIAQHIYMASSNHVTINAIASSAAVLHTYLFARVFNKRFPGFPFPGRCVAYALTSALCGIAYIYMIDMTTYSRERHALDKAASLSPEYATGAIEYYERVIVRNKAIRTILGKKGASKYTARGNLNTIIRTPHVPLSACLDRAKELKAQLEQEAEE